MGEAELIAMNGGGFANVLVIAAHPDDELLGEGATIRRLVNEGTHARAVVMAEGITSRSETREMADPNELELLRQDALSAAEVIGYEGMEFCGLPDNRMDQLDLLDIVKLVSRFVDEHDPDTIFTHHPGDLNIDHRLVCQAVLTACRPVNGNRVKRIYAFETPSSTEWNYTYESPFCPNVYFDVTETLEAKIKAMAMYKSEDAAFPHPRSAEALRALARYRGSNVGCEYAEAYSALREIW